MKPMAKKPVRSFDVFAASTRTARVGGAAANGARSVCAGPASFNIVRAYADASAWVGSALELPVSSAAVDTETVNASEREANTCHILFLFLATALSPRRKGNMICGHAFS